MSSSLDIRQLGKIIAIKETQVFEAKAALSSQQGVLLAAKVSERAAEQSLDVAVQSWAFELNSQTPDPMLWHYLGNVVVEKAARHKQSKEEVLTREDSVGRLTMGLGKSYVELKQTKLRHAISVRQNARHQEEKAMSVIEDRTTFEWIEECQ